MPDLCAGNLADTDTAVTPAERIAAVRTIANALENEDWSDLLLIHKQFGVVPRPDFSGNRREYIYAALEDASDEGVRGLYDYAVGGAQATPSQQNRDLPWDAGSFRLFASHSSTDKVLVGEVKRLLASFAVDLFVAHEDIDPTKEWLDEIDLAVDTCDALAAFLTPHFHSSSWCDQEVGFAMRRRVLIIPVCLGVTPYGFMNRFQGLNATHLGDDAVADSIFNILVTNALTTTRLSEAIVDSVASVGSWVQANRLSRLLRYVGQWTPPLLRKLEECLESNPQVSGSFDAPRRIRAIIARNSSQQE